MWYQCLFISPRIRTVPTTQAAGLDPVVSLMAPLRDPITDSECVPPIVRHHCPRICLRDKIEQPLVLHVGLPTRQAMDCPAELGHHSHWCLKTWDLMRFQMLFITFQRYLIGLMGALTKMFPLQRLNKRRSFLISH